MSDYKTVYTKINNGEILTDDEIKFLKESDGSRPSNEQSDDVFTDQQIETEYDEYVKEVSLNNARMARGATGGGPQADDRDTWFESKYGPELTDEEKQFAIKYDEEGFDAVLLDYADTLDDKDGERTKLITLLKNNILNKEEKQEIFRTFKFNNGKIQDKSVKEQTENAVDRISPEMAGFFEQLWGEVVQGKRYGDFVADRDKAREQIDKNLKAGRPPAGAAPASETAEADKKRDLGEKYVNSQQCYLLDGVNKVADHANKYNKTGTFANRLYRVRSSKPEMFFNNMGFPAASNKQLYGVDKFWTNYPNYHFYITKKVGNQELKLNVKDAFVQDSSVSAKISSLDISFNGTNPASARSDIKVDIQIEFEGGLELLTTVLNTKEQTYVGSDKTIKNENEGFKLVDLVLRPEFYRDGEGLQKYKRSQYHPNYNRTELVLESVFVPGVGAGLYDDVATQEINSEAIKSYISFGLAMVDHEINYQTESGGNVKTTIKLTYYSYVQTFLNMPYVDALGGKEVLQARQAREEELAQFISDSPNSKNQIKLRRRNNKKAAIEEIQKNKNRILEKLRKANLIYKTKVTNDELEAVEQKAINGNLGFNGKNIEAIEDFSGGEKDIKDFKDDQQYIYFFTLADLVAVVSDIFYDEEYKANGSASTYNTTFAGKLEPKFLFLDITLDDDSANPVQVNLGDIPISVE